MRAFFTRGIRGYKLPKPYRADCFSKGEHARYLQLMSIAQLQKQMKWPTREAIFSPPGIGPHLLAELAQGKIQTAIRTRADGADARVGILTRNPDSADTEAPLALVCEFPRAVSDATLTDCHHLAWLFVRAPLLITVEPHRVKTWTCCERPAAEGELPAGQGEIMEAGIDLTASLGPSEQAAHALHWVRLASGDFYRQFPDRFRRDGRANRLLLEGLKHVRKRLQKQGLNYDRIHDLLARVVFSQFLFDRKDSDGRPALNANLLSRLQEEGLLLQQHSELGSILADYDEAYRFFRWLNDKFNGDLFPGKGDTLEKRRARVASRNGASRTPASANPGGLRERPAPWPAEVPVAIVLVRRGAAGIH